MHNQRNRRAATPKPPRGKQAPARPPQAPAFPAEIAIPPRRGPVAREVEQPAPPLAALFKPPSPAAQSAKTAKRKPAAQRRKAQRKARVLGKAPPRGPRLAAPAIALPAAAEPLVEAAARPQSRALVPYRGGGMWGQLSQYLARSAQRLWDRLGGVPSTRPGPRRTRLSPEQIELRRLKAENERLKRLLAAIEARNEASPIRTRTRQTLPQA